VRAVNSHPADTVAIAGAAGGVGATAVQLATTRRGHGVGHRRTVNDTCWFDHGAVPVNYGDDLVARLRTAAPSGRIDAMLDFFGGGYVAMAVETWQSRRQNRYHHRLPAVERFGSNPQWRGMRRAQPWSPNWRPGRTRELDVPIAGVFALDDVRVAYRELEKRHTRGKLVLRP